MGALEGAPIARRQPFGATATATETLRRRVLHEGVSDFQGRPVANDLELTEQIMIALSAKRQGDETRTSATDAVSNLNKMPVI